ncbi:MAG: hypothetical protein R3C14_44245 [Caldilineaceae bacterium]
MCVLVALLCCLTVGWTANVQITQAANIDDEIVYLDVNGYIRVYDYYKPHPDDPEVKWVSPEGGWEDFVLGDFNGDGDQEIVTYKATDDTHSRLVVYEPVVASGSIEVDQIINGIPWLKLYDTTIAGQIYEVAAGDLNPAIAGAEIAYVYHLNPEDVVDPHDQSRIVLLERSDDAGQSWQTLVDGPNFEEHWDRMTIGDLDGEGAAEVVLVDRTKGVLAVYRLEEGGLAKLYKHTSDSFRWQAAIVTNFLSDPMPELIASRIAPQGTFSLWVSRYDPFNPDIFFDIYKEFFAPPPDVLFACNVNDNPDTELFMLRSAINAVRLIGRNSGTDPLKLLEAALDADNKFQGGDCGDIDGDGLGEVVVMSADKFRVFADPANSDQSTDTAAPFTTNQRTIHIGNLDRNGIQATPEFKLTPTSLTATLAAGEVGQATNFNLLNVGAPGAIPFTLQIEGDPAWITVTPLQGQTPATFDVKLDASLQDPGDYTTKLLITSSNSQVINAPLEVPVTLHVQPGLAPHPTAIDVALYPCTASQTKNVALTLDGPTGMTFLAAIKNPTPQSSAATSPPAVEAAAPRASNSLEWPSEGVTWVSARSSNVLPTTMTLTFGGQDLTASVLEANLELYATDSNGPQNRVVPLRLYCAQHQLYLPLVENNGE